MWRRSRSIADCTDSWEVVSRVGASRRRRAVPPSLALVTTGRLSTLESVALSIVAGFSSPSHRACRLTVGADCPISACVLIALRPRQTVLRAWPLGAHPSRPPFHRPPPPTRSEAGSVEGAEGGGLLRRRGAAVEEAEELHLRGAACARGSRSTPQCREGLPGRARRNPEFTGQD